MIEPDNISDTETLKKLGIEVTVDLHTRFKTTASGRRMSLKDALSDALEAWISAAVPGTLPANAGIHEPQNLGTVPNGQPGENPLTILLQQIPELIKKVDAILSAVRQNGQNLLNISRVSAADSTGNRKYVDAIAGVKQAAKAGLPPRRKGGKKGTGAIGKVS